MPMAKNIFLYHNECSDGFGAAWSAWKKFGKKGEYIAVHHGEPYPENLEGKDVYSMDFCYPVKETKEILKKAASITLIDHHKTAKAPAKLLKNPVLDMNHSGAVLAWKYFHPKTKVPKLLSYVEDRDLWRWKLRNSREISAVLSSYKMDFQTWSKIARELESTNGFKKYVQEGKSILRSEGEKIKHAVMSAELVEFCGYKVYVSNSFHFVSEIAHELYKKRPPLSIVWSARRGKVVVSLRSNGKVDVSELAGRFSGGGHKASAGFRLGLGEKFPWKIVNE
jgi:oligoribonuclease NrnB/cAMP/cGMP phosphodiesterase (DHH superfamily)